MAKRKEYTPEYKAKLVIEVLREEQTMQKLVSSHWRLTFLSPTLLPMCDIIGG
mgnify:CR=1 FL=1